MTTSPTLTFSSVKCFGTSTTETSPVSSLTVTSFLALLMSRTVTLTEVVSVIGLRGGLLGLLGAGREAEADESGEGEGQDRTLHGISFLFVCCREGRLDSIPAAPRERSLLHLVHVTRGMAHIGSRLKSWRKRVGVEPTRRPFRSEHAGFEDQGGRRTPCASGRILPGTQRAVAGVDEVLDPRHRSFAG